MFSVEIESLLEISASQARRFIGLCISAGAFWGCQLNTPVDVKPVVPAKSASQIWEGSATWSATSAGGADLKEGAARLDLVKADGELRGVMYDEIKDGQLAPTGIVSGIEDGGVLYLQIGRDIQLPDGSGVRMQPVVLTLDGGMLSGERVFELIGVSEVRATLHLKRTK